MKKQFGYSMLLIVGLLFFCNSSSGATHSPPAYGIELIASSSFGDFTINTVEPTEVVFYAPCGNVTAGFAVAFVTVPAEVEVEPYSWCSKTSLNLPALQFAILPDAIRMPQHRNYATVWCIGKPSGQLHENKLISNSQFRRSCNPQKIL